jgi:hypothetical protein
MYPFRTSDRRFAVANADESRCERRKADARTRTGDPFITSEVLYQLSYVGAVAPV